MAGRAPQKRGLTSRIVDELCGRLDDMANIDDLEECDPRLVRIAELRKRYPALADILRGLRS